MLKNLILIININFFIINKKYDNFDSSTSYIYNNLKSFGTKNHGGRRVPPFRIALESDCKIKL
ncbi:hypothetical protein BpHYR1_001715 [Brachionus plicatilis]|uniref:Uncharacterized protein n=1 Tax=Brachionus plicatilis TaxID=10195 RepID=A0A3M7SZZ0_BRAPC|nr:hypothetical protein BpHYR1_001715 [Brachionus plicatilis]